MGRGSPIHVAGGFPPLGRSTLVLSDVPIEPLEALLDRFRSSERRDYPVGVGMPAASVDVCRDEQGRGCISDWPGRL